MLYSITKPSFCVSVVALLYKTLCTINRTELKRKKDFEKNSRERRRGKMTVFCVFLPRNCLFSDFFLPFFSLGAMMIGNNERREEENDEETTETGIQMGDRWTLFSDDFFLLGILQFQQEYLSVGNHGGAEFGTQCVFGE